MPKSKEDKRRELSQAYSRMSEDELAKLAEEAVSLTDAAKEILRDELSKRGSNVRLAEPEKVETSRSLDLVIVQKFRDLPEALIAKDVLTSAGLECFLADAATVRMDWFLSNALGGIKLCVRRDDAEAAVNLLKESRTQESYEEEDRKFEEPYCPQCQSKEVSLGDAEQGVSYGNAILESPMLAEHPGWKCRACGHTWGESAEPGM
jgi:hypothetical protein